MDGKLFIIERLYEVVVCRKEEGNPHNSYTASLFASGRARVAQKLGEEALETVLAAVTGKHSQVISESADLLYHLIVLWAEVGVQPEEVWRELEGRFGTSGFRSRKQYL